MALMDQLIQEMIEQKIEKDENLSETFKNRGNENYKNKNFIEAIVSYNQGLCNAKSRSQLSLLYANRAAVYLEVKRYRECLENIQVAKKYGYPEDKMPKLLAREEKCKNLMEKNIKNENDKELENFVKLSYKSHPTIPFIIDGIECKKSDQYGRYLITTRDLKPGDIIAIEEPFVKWMKRESEMRFQCCASCLGQKNLNLYPCNKCSQIMYCSYECIEKDQFHRKISCGDVISERWMRSDAAINTCCQVTDQIFFDIKFTQMEQIATDVTIFDFKEFNRENNLRIFASLATLKKPFDHLEDLKSMVSMIYRRLRFPTSEDDFIRSITHGMNVMNANSFGVDFVKKLNETSPIGCCICLFGSLFNHSCDPNIQSFFHQDKLVFYVDRPIKAGEQLMVSYCFVYPSADRKHRRLALKNYEFDCKCRACINNWPILDKLPQKDDDFEIPPSHETLHDVKSLIKLFKKNCKYLEKIWKFDPCAETALLRSRNLHIAMAVGKQRL